jgi:hypothetical protein
MQAWFTVLSRGKWGAIRTGGAVREIRQVTQTKAGSTGVENRNDAPQEDDFVC